MTRRRRDELEAVIRGQLAHVALACVRAGTVLPGHIDHAAREILAAARGTPPSAVSLAAARKAARKAAGR